MATIPTELTNAQITLVKLRTWARSIARLSLVMMAARSLAEWDDAQTYMAELLEQAGDAMDQTTPEEQGLGITRSCNPRRSCWPAATGCGKLCIILVAWPCTRSPAKSHGKKRSSSPRREPGGSRSKWPAGRPAIGES